MIDLNTPTQESGVPLPALDAEAIITVVGGLALAVFGATMVLRVPQARDLCGRLLRHQEVQEAGRQVARVLVQGAASSLGL